MKTVFITIDAPFGDKEAFLTTELISLNSLNQKFAIFPIRRLRSKSLSPNLNKLVVRSSYVHDTTIIFFQVSNKICLLATILFFFLRTQRLKRFLYTIYFLPRTLLLIDFIEKNQIKHIHAYWAGAPATCALIASKLTKATFSFSIHRADIETNDILCYKAQQAKFVRSISTWGKNEAIKRGVAERKIRVIHLGVSIPKELRPREKLATVELVCVANLIKLKRIDYLVNKISKMPNVRLSIIGQGPMDKKIKRLSKKLKVENRVTFLGQLSQNELFELYKKQQYDLFVLPSSIEGIPVSAMEAMAYSIPVALTKVGGVPELINHTTGYYLDKNFNNLDLIINDIPNQAIIKAARKRVNTEFSTTKNASKLIQIIKSNV